jgi:amino acid adenylation domain-containing protein
MNHESLLAVLKEKMIQIGVVDGKLKVLDPEGRLDEQLLAALREHKQALIALLSHQEYLAPADFPYADLDETGLQEILRTHGDLEDIYIATPLQAGMLFHAQDDAGASYAVRHSCDLTGALDVGAFASAWQRVVAKYAALRTTFHVDSKARVHQLVHRQCALALRQLDWRDIAADSMAGKLARYKQEDLARGFDFAAPPLMRLTLIRTAEQDYHFIWLLHHSVCDGWSQPLIFSEVLQQYAALTRGTTRETAPVVPYANYIAWLHRQDTAAALEYWKQYLDGIRQKTPLQIDTLPVATGVAGSTHQSRLADAAMWAGLRQLSERMSCSMNTIVQAAWGALLQRYSGESDVVFGATVSGRPPGVEGVERIVGLFINTIPVRLRLAPATSLRQALEQVHAAFFNGSDYAHLGLGDIQRCADLPHGERLFDSLLVYQNFPQALEATELGGALGLTVRNTPGIEQTNYSLLLNVFDAQQPTLKLSYRKEQFAQATIIRLLDHLEEILRNFATCDLDSPVTAMFALGDEEARQLSGAWRQLSCDYGPDVRLDTLMERQAAATPDAIALVCGKRKLTYAQLNARSNQLAHYLIEHDVRRHTPVGILVERSIEMMVGLFAIMKAGGAYVPMDPKFPASRLEFIMKDSGMPLLLTQESLAPLVADAPATMVCIDSEALAPVLAKLPETNPDAERLGLQADDLIYILYTSGSTGMPKGVLVEHQSVCNFLYYSAETFMPPHLKGSLVSSPLVFDGTVCTLFTPFLRGKYVELMTADDTDLALLGDYIFDDEDPLLIKVTPSHMDALSHGTSERNAAVRHVIVIAGERLPHQLMCTWKFDRLPGVAFFNEYGPTECSVGSTVFPVTDGYVRDMRRASVPIGAPLANARLFVLNEQRQMQPVGVPGQLYIGGKGVARGYLNRDELTQDKFIVAAIGDGQPERLYKTGDLVRWLDDGQIEFIDRVDFQVKLRGLRIELGEIEQQIMKAGPVKNTVVVCDHTGGGRLVAYVVLDEEQRGLGPEQLEVRAEGFRAALSRVLPAYMVPSEFMVLDELPLSTNGKVDRGRLPKAEGKRRAAAAVAPETALEQQLAAIWCKVLGLQSVGVTDNFFQLGGHSLLVMRLLSEIKRELGASVTINAFFKHADIRALANHLAAHALQANLATLDDSLVEEGSF